MAATRTPPRSGLRLADLKQRQPDAKRLLNAKVPAHIAEAIATIATRVGASKTEVFVALINTGLDALQRRKRS